MLPLHRKAPSGVWAVTLLAIMTAFALSGCTSSPAPPVMRRSAASIAETGTPFMPNGGVAAAVAPWYERMPSIPLDVALSRYGNLVSLPDTTVVGTMAHVSLAPGTRSLDAPPELLILYSSGAQLFIDDNVVDLQGEADTRAPFIDGRQTLGDMRHVDGVSALVIHAGTQNGSHSRGNRVPAQLIWNSDGLRYHLTASNERTSTDHLIAIMRTMRPATR